MKIVIASSPALAVRLGPFAKKRQKKETMNLEEVAPIASAYFKKRKFKLTTTPAGNPAWSNGLVSLFVHVTSTPPSVKAKLPLGIQTLINSDVITDDLDYEDYQDYGDVMDAKIPAWFEAWEKRIKSQIKKSWAMKFLAS